MFVVKDLYCGAGGFSKGFKDAGCQIELGVDIWDKALATYNWNLGVKVLKADVRELSGGDIGWCDILIGSPPCPDFSVQRYAGRKTRDKKPDLSCIEAFMRLVLEVKPKVWIWENTIEVIKYYSSLPFNIFDAQNYGTPQRRKRVFVGNYSVPKRLPRPKIIAPTIVGQELSGGFEDARGRRFSQWLGRKPTWEEMAYYMGFPPEYVFVGNQHDKGIQIGNAVCPPMAKALATAMVKIKEEDLGKARSSQGRLPL